MKKIGKTRRRNIRKIQKRGRVSYNIPTNMVKKESLKEGCNAFHSYFHLNRDSNSYSQNSIKKINLFCFCIT